MVDAQTLGQNLLKHVLPHRRSQCVPRIKQVVAIMSLAFGWLAMLHGPVDALSDWVDAASSLGGIAVMHVDEPAKLDGSQGGPATRWVIRTGNLPWVAIPKSGLTWWPPIGAISLNTEDGDLCFLLANWQFLRRAALAPRAPSIRV